MKVILVGYMGSGKSVIGQKLADLLQIPGIELDEVIAKTAKMTVDTIFSKKGELYFRKLEHGLFLDYMQSAEDFVMSTGGGTPCYYNHQEWLKSEGVVSIYLKASVDTLYGRLVRSRKKRPLLENLTDESLKEYIAKHLFDRNYYYHQAQHTVFVDGKSVGDIVSEIRDILA